jgi:hypothetical protein
MSRPRAADAHDPMQLDRGRCPIELELGRVELVRVDGLADLWLRLAEAAGERVEDEPRTDSDELDPQLVSRHVATDRHCLASVDRAGVEPLFDIHHAHAGDLVPREDCPLDRRGAAPSGQQREMHVDHPKPREHVRLDQPAERDHHTELGRRIEVEYVVDAIGDGKAELEARGLHR